MKRQEPTREPSVTFPARNQPRYQTRGGLSSEVEELAPNAMMAYHAARSPRGDLSSICFQRSRMPGASDAAACQGYGIDKRSPRGPCFSLRNALSLWRGWRVDISFGQKRLRDDCNDSRKLKGRYGAEMAKVIQLRLDNVRAARTLEDMRRLPGRCHELLGDRAGQLSVDLRGPYRLFFVPAHNPLPARPDGGLNWSEVTAVRIIGVEDPHG